MERDEKLYQAKSTSFIFFFQSFVVVIQTNEIQDLKLKTPIGCAKVHCLTFRQDKRKLNVLDSTSPPLQIQLMTLPTRSYVRGLVLTS